MSISLFTPHCEFIMGMHYKLYYFVGNSHLPAHLGSRCYVFPAIPYLVLDEAQQSLAMVGDDPVDGILATYKTIIS